MFRKERWFPTATHSRQKHIITMMYIFVVFSHHCNDVFDATPNGLLALKGHHYNDVAITINYHYIIVNISRSVQRACAKTANVHDGLVLRDFLISWLHAISLVGLNVEGKFAMFGFVYYGEECTPSALLVVISLLIWSTLSAIVAQLIITDSVKSYPEHAHYKYRCL